LLIDNVEVPAADGQTFSCVDPYEDAIANGIDFGLVAGFWTENLSRAHRLAGRLESGVVWINTWRALSNQMPFGGVKASGIGRESALHALDEYTRTQAAWLGLPT
jgi:aldehyde dehydrogenase (NAD+)